MESANDLALAKGVTEILCLLHRSSVLHSLGAGLYFNKPLRRVKWTVFAGFSKGWENMCGVLIWLHGASSHTVYSDAVDLSLQDAISKQAQPRTTPTLPPTFSPRKRLAEGVSGLQGPRANKTMDFIPRRPRTQQIRRNPAKLNPGYCSPGARVFPPVLPFRQRTG